MAILTGINIIRDVIDMGIPRRVAVDLTEDISMHSLGVCGGIMDVYVERWPAKEHGDAER